ncbi:MAG: glycosyltransferase [Magnetococcales bacterium]|nr:glycosyltransferase [Magnetococcales bacterium]
MVTRPFQENAPPRLSVIIPTLNESGTLPKLLEQLWQAAELLQKTTQLKNTPPPMEILVADGGSQDQTREAARRGRAIWVPAPPGRANQMNRAAQSARGKDLLFLHADSTLTQVSQLKRALATLDQNRKHQGHHRIAGHFAIRFQHQGSPEGRSRGYRYYELKSALNRPDCTNGDQGLLLAKAWFQELGGFDGSLPFLEDQRLAAKIREKGHWITLPGTLTTSARRFESEGLARRQILNALIMASNAIGFQDFFDAAPRLYRQQQRAGPLKLAPFFALIQRLNREAGIKTAFFRWRGCSRYASCSAWQLFFFLDVTPPWGAPSDNGDTTPDQGFWLQLHDRWLRPILCHPLFDLIMQPLLWIWFLLSWAWFDHTDR